MNAEEIKAAVIALSTTHTKYRVTTVAPTGRNNVWRVNLMGNVCPVIEKHAKQSTAITLQCYGVERKRDGWHCHVKALY